MVSRWQKLNYLIPEPQCRMKEIGGILQIVEWRDQRAQPSDSEIDNVTEEVVNTQIEDEEGENILQSNKLTKLLFELNLNLENRVRTLEGRPTVDKAQSISYLKDLYKAI